MHNDAWPNPLLQSLHGGFYSHNRVRQDAFLKRRGAQEGGGMMWVANCANVGAVD